MQANRVCAMLFLCCEGILLGEASLGSSFNDICGGGPGKDNNLVFRGKRLTRHLYSRTPSTADHRERHPGTCGGMLQREVLTVG